MPRLRIVAPLLNLEHAAALLGSLARRCPSMAIV